MAMLVGCAGVVSPEMLKARDDVQVIHNASTQASAGYQSELDKLPANAPARKALEDAKKVSDESAQKSQKALDVANAAITAIQTGDYAAGGIKIAGSIPALVPYSGLIGISIVAVTALFTGMKRKQNEQDALKALKQVVVSVDKVLPDDAKPLLSNMQDVKTKALVTAAKNGTL